MVFYLHLPYPFLSVHIVAKTKQPHFLFLPLGQNKQGETCLQHSGLPIDYPRDCFCSHLTWKLGNSSIIWISDWEPPKAVAGAAACESCRAVDTWVQETIVRGIHLNTYRTSKAMRSI